MSAKIRFCPSERLECQAFTTHSYICMFTHLNIEEACSKIHQKALPDFYFEQKWILLKVTELREPVKNVLAEFVR